MPLLIIFLSQKVSGFFFPTTILYIGVGRFRILRGARFRILGGLEYWGGGARFRILGGAKGGQIPSRHMASLRRHLPTRFLINQCQIITFLILKSDNIEKIQE